MKKIIIALFLSSSIFLSSAITPKWVALPELEIVSYNIYLGTTPQNLKLYKTVDKTITSYLFTNMEVGTYYFQVEAVCFNGEKSGRSPMVSYNQTIPPIPIVTNKRFINVQMSTDGGKTYNSIGKVPYPKITGQKYKTNIITEK